MDPRKSTEIVRTEASLLGFKFITIAKAERLNEEAKRLEQWLNLGYQGRMTYMENHFEKRVDPTKLFPDARSVISLMHNYFTPLKQNDPEAPRVSMYALGRDYHKVIAKKLKKLIDNLREKIGDFAGRGFVDSAPILERDWAKKSGAGWIGKNTLLIHPKFGSYFFLAELIVDLELEAGFPIRDHCGTCRKCIDACPTDAIDQKGYVLNASRCISYLTIELRESIPAEFKNKMEGWVFGCDICQDVCPWNRFSKPHSDEYLLPNPELIRMSRSDWLEITKEVFDEVFNGSAVKRTKFEGLERNIKFIQPDEST